MVFNQWTFSKENPKPMAESRILYDLLANTQELEPDKISFRKRDKEGKFPGIRFQDLKTEVDALSHFLLSMGVQLGDRIGLFCDASPLWLRTDLSIQSVGAVVVPRGTDIVSEEILYILNHSEARFLFVQKEKDKERLVSLKKDLKHLEQVFVIEDDQGGMKQGKDGLKSLLEIGKQFHTQNPDVFLKRRNAISENSLATLIYTSGTTGNPKGVMLSQKSWITAILNTSKRLGMRSDDTAVSLLPPWHAFERAVEYATVYLGVDLLISNMGSLKDDLREFRPSVFPSVPRIWESVYNGILAKVAKEGGLKEKLFHFFIRKASKWARYKAIFFGYEFRIRKPSVFVSWFGKLYAFVRLVFLFPAKVLSIFLFAKIHKALGGRIRICISAGSALPSVVDDFLSAIGLKVLEGYGMTETSAVVSIRSSEKPTKGTVGVPIPGYQIRFKDEKGNKSNIGEKGTLWIKSDQILKGYYKRPELNQVVFDSEGFFDTGDLMIETFRGELVFAGRSKDTIALIGGENVEPVPIEDLLLSSPFIDQVMVVGHDKKTLGALIVPNFALVEEKLPALEKNTNFWNGEPKVRELFKKEVARLISKEKGFKAFEMIPMNQFYILPRPFDPDKEMTRTLKMKRNVISDNFRNQIEELYK